MVAAVMFGTRWQSRARRRAVFIQRKDAAMEGKSGTSRGIGNESRRSFLAKTAAAAGVGGLLAASTAAAAGSMTRHNLPKARVGPRPDANETLRLAVIGTGGMGTAHCHSFMSLVKDGKANAKFVALADVCEPRLMEAKKACEEKQGDSVDATMDYREVLKRDDIHGIVIASPEHWHAKHAEDAIAAGKDIYLEKPMTLRLDEALRLYEVSKANPDVIVQVGTQAIQMPKYREARKVVESGKIGTITMSQTSYCRNNKKGEWLYYGIDDKWEPGKNLDWEQWCGPAGSAPWNPEVYARWRRYRKYSTGIMGDLLVHVITPLMVSLGKDVGWPVRVTGTGSHLVDKAMENHDQVNLTIEFENGHVMVVAGSTCNEVGLETMIRGHKGNVYLGGRHCVVRPERIYSDDFDTETIECPDIGNDQDVHRLAWMNSLRTREHHEADVAMGAKVMVMVDLATRSAWDGRAYRFDPKTMSASPA
jgi:predicted dehydrogenase